MTPLPVTIENINLKWIIHLNIGAKTLKLSDENRNNSMTLD